MTILIAASDPHTSRVLSPSSSKTVMTYVGETIEKAPHIRFILKP